MNTHYDIDLDEVKRVADHLGLKHPVHIQGSAGKKFYGRYHGLSYYTVKGRELGDLHHQVSIGCEIKPEKAGETIIHELAHARQREREREGMTSVDQEYFEQSDYRRECILKSKSRLTKRDKYYTDPIEIEAREVASFLIKFFPNLVKTQDQARVYCDRTGRASVAREGIQ